MDGGAKSDGLRLGKGKGGGRMGRREGQKEGSGREKGGEGGRRRDMFEKWEEKE